MRFKGKKVYGSYKRITCPFCERNATQKNQQGLDVCHLHTKQVFDEIKCLCGSWLELRSGKFGPYFNCVKCGNVNYDKAMTIKESTDKKFGKEIEKNKTGLVGSNFETNESTNLRKSNYFQSNQPVKKKPTETIITSNDVEYFD